MSKQEDHDNSDNVRIFVADTAGPVGLASFFEEENGRGCLYVSDRKADRIIKHLKIYDDSKAVLRPEERDVQVLWSKDGTRCGVAIWGRMRGILDIATGHEIVATLEQRHDPAVTDQQWLRGFETYLDQEEFIRARQRYWKERLKENAPDIESLPQLETPIQTNFIIYDVNPNKIFAVFEDEGDSGYLYVYGPEEQTILRFLHVYDRSKKLNVARHDVRVVWSENGSKCGVVIWEKMRGIIDLTKDFPGRVWLESRTTPGIDDQEWLSGF